MNELWNFFTDEDQNRSCVRIVSALSLAVGIFLAISRIWHQAVPFQIIFLFLVAGFFPKWIQKFAENRFAKSLAGKSAPHPVGVMEDIEGKGSYMRLASVVAFIASAVLTFGTVYSLEPLRSFDVISILLICAFVPKVLQKFIEIPKGDLGK